MRTLAMAAIVWPMILGASVWARQSGRTPIWTTAVYAASSRICHQRPDRSFQTAGVQWPVCGRCAGLYLAAPIGAIAALVASRRRRSRLWQAGAWPMFLVAAIPTALTLAIEWPGLGAPSNLTRALAALPLGAAIAFLIVRVARGAPTNRIN
jgi:uncharacterized membrane protein